MTTSVVSLTDLEQRIADQQAELEALRQEHETRRAMLANLADRKKELEADLRQVEKEIASLTRGKREVPAVKATVARPLQTPTSSKPNRPTSTPKLADVLIKILKEARRPMKVRELSDEIVRRRFPTTSQNIPGLVKSRVQDLFKSGILHRSGDQGVTIGSLPNGKSVSSPKASSFSKKPASSTAKTSPVAKSPGMKQPGSVSLRQVLTILLRKSRRPMKARELAEQALATGYRSDSQDFGKVVEVSLARIPEFENVPGQGYRLKRGK